MQHRSSLLVVIPMIIMVLLGLAATIPAQPVAAIRPAVSPSAVDSSFGKAPELMYYRFDAAGTTVANQASSPVGANPAPIVGQTIGNSGQFGSALVGSGGRSATDFVNTGWATNLGAGSWTLSFWTSNVPSSSTLFYFFGDINASGFRAFTNGVAGAENVILRGGGMVDVLVTGAATSQPNVVHFVYDSTVPEIRAYKNGVLVNTVAQPSLNINGAGPFQVGGYYTYTGLASGQLFDEFRLYNRALSAEEISATWDQPLPLLPTITLTKSVEPVTARPGDPITYTVTFSNTSNVIASNLLITDTLASDITNSTVATSGISLTQAPGSEYVWSASSLGARSGGVITITGTLASPRASGILTNTVLLSTAEVTKTAEAPLTIENVAPVANAGADQGVDHNQAVTLDGSGSSDANGDSLTYGWTQTGGPLVALSSATAISPTFISPAASTVLTFTLMVTDSLGLADATPDEIVVTVTHRQAGYASTPAPGSAIAVGSVDVGESRSSTITISETGNTALQVTGLSISGANANNFSVSPQTISIADGALPQALTITCTPTAAGLHTATLSITHNGANSPAEYTLTCAARARIYLPSVTQ